MLICHDVMNDDVMIYHILKQTNDFAVAAACRFWTSNWFWTLAKPLPVLEQNNVDTWQYTTPIFIQLQAVIT